MSSQIKRRIFRRLLQRILWVTADSCYEHATWNRSASAALTVPNRLSSSRERLCLCLGSDRQVLLSERGFENDPLTWVLTKYPPSAKRHFWWGPFKEHLATVAAVIARWRKYHKIRPCNNGGGTGGTGDGEGRRDVCAACKNLLGQVYS